jgi:hypothetical protein
MQNGGQMPDCPQQNGVGQGKSVLDGVDEKGRSQRPLRGLPAASTVVSTHTPLEVRRGGARGPRGARGPSVANGM